MLLALRALNWRTPVGAGLPLGYRINGAADGASVALAYRIQARAVGGMSIGRAPLLRRPVGATLALGWAIWEVDLAALAELDMDLAELWLIEHLEKTAA